MFFYYEIYFFRLYNILALKRDLSSCDFMTDAFDFAIKYYEMFNKTPDVNFFNCKLTKNLGNFRTN